MKIDQIENQNITYEQPHRDLKIENKKGLVMKIETCPTFFPNFSLWFEYLVSFAVGSKKDSVFISLIIFITNIIRLDRP